MNNRTELVTLKEAARQLAVCRTTVYRLAWAGKLRLFRIGARSTRVRAADIEALLTNAPEINLRAPSGAHSDAAPADAA
ncbi:helix-turn-helix transcriptional regulator [Acidibrevibacterium fodinaquatile]|uniref:helix-turn-helix transcriptional regulator n=1 Tax=Acidibrevibacterium fodinaquatile TaxID=1969806 RepID=UPI000E0DC9DB|nr:helix-turn-helix domain-containing protein [Acidibrevibacterium fodinaquatile]